MRYIVLMLFAVALIAGCGPVSAPPPPKEPAPATKVIKVAFVTNNASDFWKIAEAGTKKAAAEFGTEVLFRIPSAGTAEQQMQIMQDLVTLGVSGIAIRPKDPSNQTSMLNEAAAKANLITQDSDAPRSNRLCYIGTNNYDAGRAAGKLLKEALPSGGKIMLFVGTLDAQNAQDRKKGIEDEVAGSNIVIDGVRTDETDRAKAVANVEDALLSKPDVVCLVGLWSYNGPAILNGVKSAGKLGQVKIVCFDEEDATLQGVKDGNIYGTVVQQPFEFGYQSVKVLTELAKGNKSALPESKQIFIPTLSVKQDSADAFWTNLKRMTGKS